MFRTSLLAFCLFLVPFSAFAKEEIVLTVPVETSVGVPGLRGTSEVWLDLINNAKTSLHLEHFYLSDEPGEALEPVLRALRAASGRGVEIRLILDKKFFGTYPEPATTLAKLPHFSLKVIDFDKISGGIQHAKFMIADGKRFYVGSANMDWRALKHIHEVGVAGDDPAVAKHLENIFRSDFGDSAALPVDEKDVIRVVGSPESLLPKGVAFSLPELLGLLGGAEKEVQLVLYELSTRVFGDVSAEWTVLFDALESAAKRGLKVKILMDASKYVVDEPALKKLIKAGVQLRLVRFPTYSGGIIPYARLLHSKFLVVDGKTAWVGTDNWAKNYFHNSRGVGLIFSKTDLVSGLRAVFSKLWASKYAAAP